MTTQHIRHRDTDMILTFEIHIRLLNHEFVFTRKGISKRAYQVADMAKISMEQYKKAAATLEVMH